MAEESQEDILEDIMDRLKQSGDLPIFSASVNRVQLVGSDPDSDAMTLSMEVLKDANLTTRVLKLANSSYYNRGQAKVGALSRAIVMLGFDVIKSTVLTMKMIESFQYEHPSINMDSLLVNAYLSAGFVREMATECGIKEVEQSYICGLLHNLGEVVTAYTMPEEYLEIHALVKNEQVSWARAQKRILGMPLRKIGKGIVEKWEFPDTVVNTIAAHHRGKKLSIRDKVALNRGLASVSSEIMSLLYSDTPTTTASYSDLIKDLTKMAGLSTESVTNCLETSFKQSCDLANEYGLDKKLLCPKIRVQGNDTKLDKMARQLSYYAVNKDPAHLAPNDNNSFDVGNNGGNDDGNNEGYDDGYDTEPQEVVEYNASEVNSASIVGDANVLLSVLHELTGMMANKAQLNSVFKKILEGLQLGVGFDRALFCFLSPDHQYYSSRLACGQQSESLKSYFEHLPIDTDHDLFSKLIMEGNELLVPDVTLGSWAKLLPKHFVEKVGVRSFAVAAIRIKERPIGLIYADKVLQGITISSDDNRGFMQMVAQAHLALQVR